MIILNKCAYKMTRGKTMGSAPRNRDTSLSALFSLYKKDYVTALPGTLPGSHLIADGYFWGRCPLFPYE